MTSAAPPADQKSKLDSLSKEDLIRFVKKQVGNLNECKQRIASLTEQLKERDESEKGHAVQVEEFTKENATLRRKIEELETKQQFLNQTATCENEGATANELILKTRVVELEEQTSKFSQSIREWKEKHDSLMEKSRELEVKLEESESALSDSRAELAALRESRATVDVFSLEIKDYEKKVDVLEKKLAESNQSLATTKAETEKLQNELSQSREMEKKAADDCLQARENADSLRKQLIEEKTNATDLQMQLSQTQERLNILEQDRGSERIGLGRELAVCQERVNKLEEIVEALRSENTRLSRERDEAESRLTALSGEYESFKNRARFVLEQQKTANVTEQQESSSIDSELRETQEVADSLRSERDELQRTVDKLKHQNSTLESEMRSYSKPMADLQHSLSETMDQLRSCRCELETTSTELSDSRRRIRELEARQRQLESSNEKLEAVLTSEKARFEKEKDRLVTELSAENERCEELLNQVNELRKSPQRVTRPAPIAAVVAPFSSETNSEQMMVRKFAMDDTQDESGSFTVEPSLEDVLFGEDSFEQPNSPEDALIHLSEAQEELRRMRIQADHTRALLSECEATNGRLVEQTSLLKKEIRRLEQNEERKSHLENTEYLKNVIMKMLTPERVSAEKCQLVPIVKTMLRLNEDEVAILQRFAQQNAANSGESSSSVPSSWGSYLRWGSLS